MLVADNSSTCVQYRRWVSNFRCEQKTLDCLKQRNATTTLKARLPDIATPCKLRMPWYRGSKTERSCNEPLRTMRLISVLHCYSRARISGDGSLKRRWWDQQGDLTDYVLEILAIRTEMRLLSRSLISHRHLLKASVQLPCMELPRRKTWGTLTRYSNAYMSAEYSSCLTLYCAAPDTI